MSYYGITGQPITTGNTYISNRKKWSHPQAMIWSRDPGTIVQSGAMTGVVEPRGTEGVDFVVTSDHNRSPLALDMQRIESRTRMVSGNMRSYYTADKANLNVSWSLLPSRAFPVETTFQNDGSHSPMNECEFTADGGCGGVDMLSWYSETIGPMWVFLAYDRYDNNEGSSNQFGLNYNYVDRKQMFFSSFNYAVEKRGIYDMWNVSCSLEEA